MVVGIKYHSLNIRQHFSQQSHRDLRQNQGYREAGVQGARVMETGVMEAGVMEAGVRKAGIKKGWVMDAGISQDRGPGGWGQGGRGLRSLGQEDRVHLGCSPWELG